MAPYLANRTHLGLHISFFPGSAGHTVGIHNYELMPPARGRGVGQPQKREGTFAIWQPAHPSAHLSAASWTRPHFNSLRLGAGVGSPGPGTRGSKRRHLRAGKQSNQNYHLTRGLPASVRSAQPQLAALVSDCRLPRAAGREMKINGLSELSRESYQKLSFSATNYIKHTLGASAPFGVSFLFSVAPQKFRVAGAGKYWEKWWCGA